MTATEKTPAPRVVTTTCATMCPKCAQPPTVSSLIHAAPGQVLHRCEPCDERWATRLANIEEALSVIMRALAGLMQNAAIAHRADTFDARRTHRST